MRYANQAALDASIPVPIEGNMAFLQAENDVVFYANGAWITIFTIQGGTINGSLAVTGTTTGVGAGSFGGMTITSASLDLDQHQLEGLPPTSQVTAPVGVPGSLWIRNAAADPVIGNATVLQIVQGTQRAAEIAVGKNGGMWFRGVAGDGPNWGTWTEVATV